MSLRHAVIGFIVISAATTAVTGGGSANAASPRHAATKPRISAPANATEGDKFALTTRIKKPSQAVRVTFQYEKTGVYDFHAGRLSRPSR